jgi:hypothetical protein
MNRERTIKLRRTLITLRLARLQLSNVRDNEADALASIPGAHKSPRLRRMKINLRDMHYSVRILDLMVKRLKKITEPVP